MQSFDKLRLRLRSLLRRERVDRELDAELRFHLEQQIEENIASGMSPDEARAAALRLFGNVSELHEECRDMREVSFAENVWRDMRHAARVLRRSPGFTAVAILTLALGIGATTAIFSVVYGVLLRPLPFEDPERLVGLYHRGPGVNLPLMNQGPATYFTYLDNHQTFEGIGIWDGGEESVTGRGEPERVRTLNMTASTLPLLRVQPLHGRFFSEEDDRPGSPLRVILTYGYWQAKFGGASDVIGQTLQLDGEPAEIIGVLPASFKFLRSDPAMLMPLQPNRAEATFVNFGFQVLGRLKPGVTLEQANADIARMIPMVEQVPGYKSLRLEPFVRPLAADVIGDIGRVLWILLGVVGLVLLIACANVANLFLVRAEGRQQELAVRSALGASRGRIARELLTESLMLGLAGGVVGVAFARAGIGLLRQLAPATLPRLDEIAIDPAVLLFALVVSLLTGLLFGVIPVLRLGTPHSTTALRDSARGTSASPVRQRTRNALVVAEVAMALVLLILSGLMIRTFLAMRDVHPGFVRANEVQTFRVEIPDALAPTPEEMGRMHEQIAQRVRQTPGVDSVGLSSSITMDGEDNTNPLNVEDFLTPEGEMPPLRRFKSVAPGYFETMGNPLVSGRPIDWTDIYELRRVVVISETLAREYWGSPTAALGRRVRAFSPNWYEIVGVSGNERDDGLNHPATAMVYWPMLNDIYQSSAMSYAVRSSRVGSPGFMGEMQQAVWSVNPNLPLSSVLTLDEIQADSMAQTSFAMVMLAIAASVALLLGVVGIYGVIAYIASQRTREIGIRMALGAQSGDVSRLFLRHGMLLMAGGIVLGVVGALAVTRVLSALLFGVSAADPLTYAAVSVGLAAIGLLATYIPVRRASRVDPLAALRAE
jgi:predicted permease